jgi:hypothetical protein
MELITTNTLLLIPTYTIHLYHFINGNISSLDKIMDGIDVNKIAIVTGSSSGIGLETSLTLAENNFTTYATCETLTRLQIFWRSLKERICQ